MVYDDGRPLERWGDELRPRVEKMRAERKAAGKPEAGGPVTFLMVLPGPLPPEEAEAQEVAFHIDHPKA